VQISMKDGRPGEIVVSGQLIGQINDLVRDDAPLQSIPGIVEALKLKKANWENTHRLAGDTSEFKGDINIQAHKAIEFKVLAPVMLSCAEAGFGNVNFATMQKGSDRTEEGKTAAVTP
jgi:hypothetical protein